MSNLIYDVIRTDIFEETCCTSISLFQCKKQRKTAT